MVTRRLMALESLEATVEVQLRSYLEARLESRGINGGNWGEISPATGEKYHLNILKWCLLSQLQLLRALSVEKKYHGLQGDKQKT